MASDVENLAQQAKEGNRAALESLVGKIQDKVYGMALRMLGNTEDAKDAAQEILVKIITSLSGFRGESAFETWAFRVAANHLLSARKARSAHHAMLLEDCEEAMDKGLSHEWRPDLSDAMQSLLVEEIRASCIQGLLQCLDPDLRICLVLGEIIEVTSEQGAFILGISAAAFRKRLSRSRERLRGFLAKNCGLVHEGSPCQCSRQIGYALKTKWVDPEHFQYAGKKTRKPAVTVEHLRELDELGRMGALFKHPDFAAPENFAGHVRDLLDSGTFRLLSR